MLACDVDQNEAFAVLRPWSQNLNEKASHLAERVARDLAATHLDDDTTRRKLLRLSNPINPPRTPPEDGRAARTSPRRANRPAVSRVCGLAAMRLIP